MYPCPRARRHEPRRLPEGDRAEPRDVRCHQTQRTLRRLGHRQQARIQASGSKESRCRSGARRVSAHPKNSPMPDKRLFVIEQGQKRGRTLPKSAVIAEVSRHIRFDPAVLDTFDVKGFEPLHYDMLVLCAAIEFADRRWKRPLGWCRTLDVAVPVIALKTWQKPEGLKALHSVFNHLTRDAWRFTLVPAQSSRRSASRTRRFASATAEP